MNVGKGKGRRKWSRRTRKQETGKNETFLKDSAVPPLSLHANTLRKKRPRKEIYTTFGFIDSEAHAAHNPVLRASLWD
jgi:hypothetical protein